MTHCEEVKKMMPQTNIGIPETDVTEYENYRPYENKRYKLFRSMEKGQKLLHKFLKTWREDYLFSLKERTEMMEQSVFTMTLMMEQSVFTSEHTI